MQRGAPIRAHARPSRSSPQHATQRCPPVDEELGGGDLGAVEVLGQQAELAALRQAGKGKAGHGGTSYCLRHCGLLLASMPGNADQPSWMGVAGPADVTSQPAAGQPFSALLCPIALLSAPHLVLVPHELHAVLHVAQQHKVLHHIQAGQQHWAVVEGYGAAGRGRRGLFGRAASTAGSKPGSIS